MKEKLRRSALVALASLAFVLAAAFVAVPSASAASTSSGCVWSHPMPRSCVAVSASGTHVNYVAGGVELGIRQYVYGHYEIWGPGFHFNTRNVSYYNASWWH